MLRVLGVTILLFFATPLWAQMPIIDSMDIDEGTSTLLIHGVHGMQKGSVSVDGIPLAVSSWEDTLIICHIPDTGKGSAGPVIVTNASGQTKPRLITKWHFNVYRWHAPPDNPFSQVERERYYLDWRFDLHSRMLAKNGDIYGRLLPMKSSWHTDTTFDSHYRPTDTLVERPYANSDIVLWYLHQFQNGHGELMAFYNQASIYQFDSNWKSKPYHDTVKNSQGVYVQENMSDGSVEFTPPPQAVWLLKQSTLKYPVIEPSINRVKLQWWFIPWAEQYELQVTRLKPDSTLEFDTVISNPSYPLIDVQRKYPDGYYRWAVRSINSEGPGVWSNGSFTLGNLGVDETSNRPSILLDNPVRSVARFAIPKAKEYTLRIFDALGREQHLTTSSDIGSCEVSTSNWADGIYFFDLASDGDHHKGKFVVKH